MAVELQKSSIDLGIISQNPEPMLKFYRDTLGFVQEEDWDMPSGDKMYRLRCGESLVKMTVPKKDPAAQAHPGGLAGSTGYRWFTMFITNMQAVLEDCKNGGYKIPVPEMEIGPGKSIAFVEDPDGNWVEFVNIS